MEGDGAQIPARFAGLGAVIDQSLDHRGGPEGFLDLALGHQLLGELHGRPARQVDQVVLGDVGQRLAGCHGLDVGERRTPERGAKGVGGLGKDLSP